MLKIGHKFYTSVAALIFILAGLIHGTRAMFGWDLVIDTWAVPLWVSWLLALVALVMAIASIRNL
ncbi:hypothetical protein CL631_03000 [bacterium]|jgi:hypothetical protein|nr:hypothetical protein [bacterium]